MTGVAMRETHIEAGLVVVDHVLPERVLEGVRQAVRGAQYRDVHHAGWDPVWRVTDGRPMRGPAVVFDPTGRVALQGRRWPTCSPVDDLIARIRELSTAHPDVAGVEGRDWAALYLVPWLYPPGGALSTHWDAGRYSGAFTFFVHRRWGLHWGGELIAPRPGPGLDQVRSQLDREILDADRWSDPQLTAAFGVSTAIQPTPNRLVLIRGDRPHRVARVDRNAGDHVRSSIAGFFLRGV